MNSTTAKAAAFWNKATHRTQPQRTRWWMSPTIIRHINKTVCGIPLDGIHGGFHELVRISLRGRIAAKAVSVGCGTGEKEMSLVAAGTVQEFHLYEISSARVDIGKAKAASLGIADRVKFHLGDAFRECADRDYDLVYWNNALHHMPDARAAVVWSRDRLRDGGLFAMDDFIGPSRFQWSDRSLEIASLFRDGLDEKYLRSPTDSQTTIPRKIRRPSIAGMIAADPSEAADSDNILPSIQEIFDDAIVTMTGGVIYHMGLNDVLANLDEEDGLLQLALMIDDMASSLGENHYAVAIASKS